MSVLEALEHAQRIAFAPFVFQAAVVLRDRGILEALESSSAGLTLDEVVTAVGLPPYGVRVLLEAGLGIGVVHEDDEGRYHATRVAYCLLHDDMTRINMDFARDVNYEGLRQLDEAIVTGRPAGLASFGSWPHIYAALSELPDKARRSWFAFDHYYSDQAFPRVLPLVLAEKPRRLLDVGGNTGRWAELCLRADPELELAILDLPGQLACADTNLREAGLRERVELLAADILDPATTIPRGYDAVWMSQFLDCFSDAEIVTILRRFRESMDPGARLYILEIFWDRQRFSAARFCLQLSSLYFTALANGDSQFYRSTVFLACVEKAGFVVETEYDDIGLGHTLLVCRPA